MKNRFPFSTNECRRGMKMGSWPPDIPVPPFQMSVPPPVLYRSFGKVSGWPGGGGFFKTFCTGMLKVDFRISTISIPQKAWFCDPSLYQFEQIGCFFGLISWNTPNFANWAHWVLNGNPPIDIPIMMKKHP